MQTSEDALGGISRLGIIANPFTAPGDTSADPLGVKLAKRNAARALLAALRRSEADSDHRPLVVEKDPDIPAMYTVAALASSFSALADGELGDVLQLYVPLDMMRIGRTRAVLHVLAERVAGNEPDRTIAAWASAALEAPDPELPEWIALTESVDVDALRARLAADPTGVIAEVFGEPVESREGAEDLEVLMRVSHARLDRLDSDPDEDTDDEVDTDDPMGEAFVTPLGEVDDRVLEAAPDDTSDAVADFLIAQARELSPVIARGLAAYRAQGINSMAEELKVTKAPSKTLTALMRFARARYAGAFLFVDRFDLFEVAPEELQNDIATALFKMRWALKDLATVVLFIEPGIAPQVEESFAASTRVSWRFDELSVVGDRDAAFPPDIALRWIDALSLEERPGWADGLVRAVAESTPAEAAFTALGTVIESAAEDGRQPAADDLVTELASPIG